MVRFDRMRRFESSLWKNALGTDSNALGSQQSMLKYLSERSISTSLIHFFFFSLPFFPPLCSIFSLFRTWHQLIVPCISALILTFDSNQLLTIVPICLLAISPAAALPYIGAAVFPASSALITSIFFSFRFCATSSGNHGTSRRDVSTSIGVTSL